MFSIHHCLDSNSLIQDFDELSYIWAKTNSIVLIFCPKTTVILTNQFCLGYFKY